MSADESREKAPVSVSRDILGIDKDLAFIPLYSAYDARTGLVFQH